jgi:hypothetical protein
VNGHASVGNLLIPSASGSAVTVEFWMWWDNSKTFAIPFFFPWTNQPRRLIYLSSNSPTVNYISITNLCGDGFYTSANNYVNKWVYVSAILKNPNVYESELYLNGVKQQMTITPYGSCPYNAPLPSSIDIGGYENSVSWLSANLWFKGKIDELRMYNRALSPAEISMHYNNY